MKTAQKCSHTKGPKGSKSGRLPAPLQRVSTTTLRPTAWITDLDSVLRHPRPRHGDASSPGPGLSDDGPLTSHSTRTRIWGQRKESSPNVIVPYVLSRSVTCDSCDPMDCSPPGSSVHGYSPGKNTAVGCYAHPPGDLHNPWIKPRSPTLWGDSEPPGKSTAI